MCPVFEISFQIQVELIECNDRTNHDYLLGKDITSRSIISDEMIKNMFYLEFDAV